MSVLPTFQLKIDGILGDKGPVSLHFESITTTLSCELRLAAWSIGPQSEDVVVFSLGDIPYGMPIE